MYTSQKEIRKAFWNAHPELDRQKIRDHSGKGKMYKADTRAAFVDFVDYLQRDGQISVTMAERVTL